MEETKKIWMSGKLVDWDKAKVHVLTHTLHYGSGVYEGIRFYNTKKGSAIFRLDDHIERMFNSSKSFNMKIPFSKKEVVEAVKEVVRVNKIKEGYIRPLLYHGYGVMGLNTSKAPVDLAIAVWPWGAYLGEDAVRVKVSRFIRIHPKSTNADAKLCGHYVNSILANLEAKENGYDEALLLDFKGNIAEGPGENIFVVKNRILKTPPLGTILPGITRASVIKLARDLEFVVREESLSLENLYKSDEAFFTGTAAEVTAIKEVDNRVIGTGEIGEVTKILKEKYGRIVRGEDKKYLNWLTFL